MNLPYELATLIHNKCVMTPEMNFPNDISLSRGCSGTNKNKSARKDVGQQSLTQMNETYDFRSS